MDVHPKPIFNPALPSIEVLVKKHIEYLHTDDVLKKVFPNNKFSNIYQWNRNLKEMVAPSSYPRPSIRSSWLLVAVMNVTSTKILIVQNKFKCTVTNKTYFIKRNLWCNSHNVVYLTTCSNFREQYVGSDIDFNPNLGGLFRGFVLRWGDKITAPFPPLSKTG